MNATDYIKAYVMKRINKDGEIYYKRDFNKGDKVIHVSLHKMELIDECYLVKQNYYPDKYNSETGTYGVVGKAKFTFGITDDIFNNLNDEWGMRWWHFL